MTTTEAIKTEAPAADLHPVIRERWSPYTWSDRDVDAGDLRALFDAARWAPSCYNEQPWRYLVGFQGDEAWQAIFDSLMGPNQAWAKPAPVLMVSVASMRYALNDKPNGHAWHDVGLATGNLLAEATARGLLAHQMGGFSADVVRERLKVYHTQTRPLVDFYAAKGVLRNIDGERDPAEVRESLLKEIKGDA